VTQMNSSSKNRRDSCAAEEVCPIRGMSVEKTLATAGVVRDNAVIVRVDFCLASDRMMTQGKLRFLRVVQLADTKSARPLPEKSDKRRAV